MRVEIGPEFAESTDAHAAAAIIRKCVHCGFCNATCPTYRLTGDELDGPRGRIYLIKQLLEGGAAGERTRSHLDRCLTCLNCETTCPSGVEYGRLVEIGRPLVEARAPRSLGARLQRALLREGLTSRGFAAAVALGRRVRPLLPRGWRDRLPPRSVATTPAHEPAPPTPIVPATHVAATSEGSDRAPRRVLLLAGCVQPSLLPAIDRATERVLAAAGVGTRVVAGAGCCGALREHLSDHAGALHAMRRNVDAWWPLLSCGEADAIVVNASACALMVKNYPRALAEDPRYAAKAATVGAAARDLGELVAALAPRLRGRVRAARAGPIAFHPPCTLQHGQRLGGVVEAALRGLGFDLRPAVRDANLCCGSAGAYSILEPAIATALRDQKVGALEETGAGTIASANVGCILHLQAGTTRPVRHWIEIVADALAAQ